MNGVLRALSIARLLFGVKRDGDILGLRLHFKPHGVVRKASVDSGGRGSVSQSVSQWRSSEKVYRAFSSLR